MVTIGGTIEKPTISRNYGSLGLKTILIEDIEKVIVSAHRLIEIYIRWAVLPASIFVYDKGDEDKCDNNYNLIKNEIKEIFEIEEFKSEYDYGFEVTKWKEKLFITCGDDIEITFGFTDDGYIRPCGGYIKVKDFIFVSKVSPTMLFIKLTNHKFIYWKYKNEDALYKKLKELLEISGERKGIH